MHIIKKYDRHTNIDLSLSAALLMNLSNLSIFRSGADVRKNSSEQIPPEKTVNNFKGSGFPYSTSRLSL